MPKKILLIDIAVNTLDPLFLAKTINEKLSLIKNALATLETTIDTSFPELWVSSQKIVGIVVMPENFFSSAGKSRQYLEKEAREIERELAKLSVEFPKILLIAPIIWKKSAYFTDEISEAKKDFAGYKQDKEQRGITSLDHERYLEKCRTQNSRIKKAEQIIDGPAGYFFDFKDNIKGVSNELYDKLRELRAKDERKSLTISRTTARFFLNGKQIGKCHKGSDFEEVRDYGNIFVSGTAIPLVQLPELSLGIEFCSNHKFGILKKGHSISANSPTLNEENKPHIHLIMSAFIRNLPENVQVKKTGGFLVHSSSEPNSRTYTQYLPDGTKSLDILQQNDFNIVTLDFPPHPFHNDLARPA